MFVCNCNGITEKQVHSAIASGASDWEDVHEHHGHEPCCGKCEGDICEAIQRMRAALAAAIEFPRLAEAS